MERLKLSKKFAKETLDDLAKIKGMVAIIPPASCHPSLILDELDITIGRVKGIIIDLEKIEEERYTKW